MLYPPSVTSRGGREEKVVFTERKIVMTELRLRMIEDMKLNGLSEGTQRVYVDAIRALAKHYRRSPELLSEKELRQYFVYLEKEKCLARSTIRIQIFAVKFLYSKTLHRDGPLLELIRVKRRRKLPVVLSPGEVSEILSLVQRPIARMSLSLMYACGLRVSEATRLCPEDIDSRRMAICVRNGKGNKDRYVPLPERTLQQLREYWKMYRPSTWLFPSKTGITPINKGSVRRCLKAALWQSSITKDITCHTLRHSYATQLLDEGLDIRIIQSVLGHRSLRSTMIYVHMTDGAQQQVHDAVNKIMGNL